MKTSTLRPGYLVSLKTSIKGGIKYDVTDLGKDAAPDGADVAKWETRRTITNAEEWERATKTRNKAASIVRRVCASTAFGLVCPENRKEELDAALKEARQAVEEFNASSEFSEVAVYVLLGKVADNDVEATKAIASEVRDLLDDMNQSIDKLNPEAIREAANRARQLGAILAPEQNAKVADAIKAARDAARVIVKRSKEAELTAEQILADVNREAISTARMAFLDFDAPVEVLALPAVAEQRFDAIDLDDDEPTFSDRDRDSVPETIAASAELEF